MNSLAPKDAKEGKKDAGKKKAVEVITGKGCRHLLLYPISVISHTWTLIKVSTCAGRTRTSRAPKV